MSRRCKRIATAHIMYASIAVGLPHQANSTIWNRTWSGLLSGTVIDVSAVLSLMSGAKGVVLCGSGCDLARTWRLVER
jgi:hypothetical protein